MIRHLLSIRAEKSIWKERVLERLASLGEEGRAAADYLRAHRTYIGFWRVRRNVGAFWTLLGTVHFNAAHYTTKTEADNIGMLTLLIHEVKHLQQGWHRAFSVYGELEAWQLQFRLYYQLTGKPMHSVLAEILSLPLTYDRDILRRARDLMQAYAGKGYRADLLPLYPVSREIRYWLMERK